MTISRCNSLLLTTVALAACLVIADPARAQKGSHAGMGRAGMSHSPSRGRNPDRAPQARASQARSNDSPGISEKNIPERSSAASAVAGQQEMEKLSMMSPEQRQKALASLPPAQQRHLEDGLANWQRMTPQQRQNAKARLEKLQSLPAEEQQQVRQAAQAFQQLPDDRKRSINQEMGQLRKMTPQQRDARVSNPDFKSKFSPAEQDIVKRRLEVLPDGPFPQD